MSAALKEPMTLTAFLDWENRQDAKYEFDGFQPVAMNVPEDLGDSLTARELHKWATCISDNTLLNQSSLAKLGTAFGSGESSLGAAQFEGGALRVHRVPAQPWVGMHTPGRRDAGAACGSSLKTRAKKIG